MNKHYLVFLIGLILSTSLLQGQGWLKAKRIQDDIQKAVASYNIGDFAEAEQILKPMKDISGNYNSTVDLLLIKISLMMKKDDQLVKTGREFIRKYPHSSYLGEVYFTYGDMFINNGKYSTAYRMYLKSRELATSDSLIIKIDDRLIKTISYSVDSNILDEKLSLENDVTVRAILSLAKSFNHLESGNHTACADELASIEPASVPDVYFDLYERLILSSFQPVPPIRKIGVVLPLSGENMNAGRSFLTGFQKGLNESKDNIEISVIIHDNKSKDIETIFGIQTLESNQDIVAAVGPLTEESSLLVSAVLTQSQLPILIPFSTQNELAELSPNVFQLNSTLETRGRYAARTALLELGLDSIAVLAPSNGEGYQLASSFIAELNFLGSNPVHVEWYSEIPEDLSRQFKSIRAKAWSMIPEEKETDAFLGMEIDSLDALFDVSGEDFFDLPEEEIKTMSTRDSSKVVLNTIHGIYIPIIPEHLRYIATQFPMYNLSAIVIGNEAWQNLDILNEKNIGPHLDSMVVVTPSVFTGSVEDYSEEESYFYTQGYDTAVLLTAAVETTIPTRANITKRLESIDEFHGTGKYISFSDSLKHVNTALQVLRYHNASFHSMGYFKGDSLYSGESALPVELTE